MKSTQAHSHGHNAATEIASEHKKHNIVQTTPNSINNLHTQNEIQAKEIFEANISPICSPSAAKSH